MVVLWFSYKVWNHPELDFGSGCVYLKQKKMDVRILLLCVFSIV